MKNNKIKYNKDRALASLVLITNLNGTDWTGRDGNYLKALGVNYDGPPELRKIIGPKQLEPTCQNPTCIFMPSSPFVTMMQSQQLQWTPIFHAC